MNSIFTPWDFCSPEQIFSTPRHPYTRALLAAIPRLTEDAADDGAAAITGDPPSPLRIPAGCRFRTRCPMAQPRCEKEDPALAGPPGSAGSAGSGGSAGSAGSAGDAEHLAACHFAFSPAADAAAPGPGASEQNA